MYPLRAWLPDMDPSTDRANRGKPLGRKLIGEHLNSPALVPDLPENRRSRSTCQPIPERRE